MKIQILEGPVKTGAMGPMQTSTCATRTNLVEIPVRE